MPLSRLEKELKNFPLLERQHVPFLLRQNRDPNFQWYILNEFACAPPLVSIARWSRSLCYWCCVAGRGAAPPLLLLC